MIVSNEQLQIAANKGRTIWLQKLLMQRLPELDHQDADYDNWFNSLIQSMEDRGLGSPSQQKDYLSDVRNAIKVLDPNHPALLVVDFDKQTWTEINNRNSDRIAERTTKFIDNPDAIVQRATVLLGSYTWSEIAAGLAVVTGRRCTEIIKTAKFEYKSKYSVRFTGSLKRKEEPLECIFEIPTLCEAELVIKAITSLKEKLGGEVNNLSKRQVSRRYGTSVAKMCDRYFDELVPPRDDKDNLYTHLFRAVYATIAAYWYCPPTIPEMEFRAAIQGHYQILDEKNPKLRRSLAAVRNYFDYKIADGQGNIDGRLGIKLGLADVEVIEQFKHSYIPPPSRQKVLNHNSDLQSSSTSSQKSKTRRSRKSIMTETSSRNSAANLAANLAIPSFLRSRLEAISNQLEISSEEAIQELFTWTEVGLSLAEELNLDELNPNAVFNSVRSLKQNASSSPSPSNFLSSSNKDDSEELALLKQQIVSLTKSLDRLTEIWHKADSANNNSDNSKNAQDHQNRVVYSTNKIKQNSQDTAQSNKKPAVVNKAKSNQQPQEDFTSSKKRRRDSSDTVREDVNHAIDAIMEFNDREGRPHNQKFYIGIGSVRELSGRGDVAIRRVLEERAEEIQQHLAKHQIDLNQNLSRKDDQGNEYPTIDQEEGINYHKITLVSS